MHQNSQRLINIFFELVAINAISKQEKPVADYIQSFLNNLNIKCEEDTAGKKVGGNTGNIIAEIPGKADLVPIALISHMDTIKPTVGIQPKLENGNIVTDGKTILGADNRAGIAIILFLIEHLIENNHLFRPIEAIFTIGEETGLFGSQNLDLNLVNSDTAFILDSSASPGCFVYAAPQAYDFEFEFIGKASHAAVHPEQGINALLMASELIQKYPLGKVDDSTTINFGKICGGEANNVVPSNIKMSGEIRSFNHDTINDYAGELENCLKIISDKFAGNYKIQGNTSFPGFELDLNSESISILKDSFFKVGLKPEAIRYHGGSDANILNNRGLFAVNLGIGAKNPHSTNEHIKIKDMEDIFKVLFNIFTCQM